MSITELFPIVQNLSPAEKIRLLEFLQAEIEQSQSASESSESMHPRLHRKNDILVIETVPLNHIDFNRLIRENQINTCNGN
ncbi:hypothetical protein [Oscillatoria acuminata]|uniref:Uncharacterized protein n=1 Tax=Oscillatoria acuminata PCC 6304 TaxID=56110 RepID=K9TJN5_9CYAN|nr:hypothetical protein [Oscillatoria acuminata]AFY83067.1 hypothetical protein Oscil6304_3501 [Oscillatoria acuminata PCC 6304]